MWFNCVLIRCSPLGGQKTSETKWYVLKVCNFKKGIGTKVKKLCKQVRDQRNGTQVLLKNENKPYSICYPYSDCGYLADVIQR